MDHVQDFFGYLVIIRCEEVLERSVCMFQLLSEYCQSVRLMFRSQLQSLELQSIVRMTTCYFRNVEGGELDILAFFARGVKLFTIYRYIYISTY